MKSVRVRHLSDVCLKVKSGQAVACVGASGSGKSTLLMAMAGLLPYEGELCICDREVSKSSRRDPRWFHQHIGFTTQFPERGFFAPTILDELMFTAQLLKMDPARIKMQTDSLLSQVGLSSVDGGRSPFTLSGGEKRRLALASALVHDPQVILFDEPDAGLDWKGKLYVAKLINDLTKLGKTFIIATHDVAWAMKWADQFILLNEGRLDTSVEWGDPLLFHHDDAHLLFLRLKEVGLIDEHPYRNERRFFQTVENELRRGDRDRASIDDACGETIG